jgi:putative oxidoreductase
MTTQTNTDYAAAALRISTGVLFLAHGWMKVSAFTIPGTVAFFESLGLPGVLAYFTIFAELAGGIALILGLGTRVVSIALIPVLLGATWAHSGFGWSFSTRVCSGSALSRRPTIASSLAPQARHSWNSRATRVSRRSIRGRPVCFTRPS